MYLGFGLIFWATEIASAQDEPRMLTFSDSSNAKLSSVYSAGDSISRAGLDRSQRKWYDMFARIPIDWVHYSEETFRDDNIPAIAGMAILTAGLIATDYETWQIEKKWYDESPVFRTVSDMFVFTGDGKFQFGIVGIFAAHGFIFNDERALRTGQPNNGGDTCMRGSRSAPEACHRKRKPVCLDKEDGGVEVLPKSTRLYEACSQL